MARDVGGQSALFDVAVCPVASSSQLRWAGTFFAAVAGGLLGLSLAMTIRFVMSGDAGLAVLALTIGVVLDIGAVVLVVLLRIVAQLVERRLEAPTQHLLRRMATLEAELSTLQRQIERHGEPEVHADVRLIAPDPSNVSRSSAATAKREATAER